MIDLIFCRIIQGGSDNNTNSHTFLSNISKEFDDISTTLKQEIRSMREDTIDLFKSRAEKLSGIHSIPPKVGSVSFSMSMISKSIGTNSAIRQNQGTQTNADIAKTLTVKMNSRPISDLLSNMHANSSNWTLVSVKDEASYLCTKYGVGMSVFEEGDEIYSKSCLSKQSQLKFG